LFRSYFLIQRSRNKGTDNTQTFSRNWRLSWLFQRYNSSRSRVNYQRCIRKGFFIFYFTWFKETCWRLLSSLWDWFEHWGNRRFSSKVCGSCKDDHYKTVHECLGCRY